MARRRLLQLQGTTRAERHAVTSQASDAVITCRGYILDYRQFSNMAVCFTIEIPPARLADLRSRLAALEVDLQPPTAEEQAVAESPSTEDVPASLRITFIHNEPDLRIEIPAIPG